MKPAAPVTTLGYARPAPPRSLIGRLIDRFLVPLAAPLMLAIPLVAFLATRLAASVVGITVLTGSRPGVGENVRPVGTTAFFVMQAERGTITGVEVVHSMAEYVEKLGNPLTTYGQGRQVEAFFNEGGDTAVIARIVGAARTFGTLTLVDRGGGGVDDTVVLTAKTPGAWSATLTVEVADGAIANTFRVYLYLAGVLVESYLEQATPAAFVTEVNARSAWVTAVDAASANASPTNNPLVIVPTVLSTGTDDRNAIVTGTYTAALARFTMNLGTGLVAIPGQTSTNVGAALKAHALAYEREVAMAPAVAQTKAQAKTAATAMRGANGTGAEGAGFYYPHVRVPDGSGGNTLISPEGYIAGVRARTIRDHGIWQPAAGEFAAARWVIGTEDDLAPMTDADVDDLVRARVNPIRHVSSIGPDTQAASVRNYAYRSLSTDETVFRNLTGRALLNLIASQVRAAFEPFVHRTVDGRGHFFHDAQEAAAAIIAPIADAGGITPQVVDGVELDPGYTIDTSAAINTPAVLGSGRFKGNIAVRPAGSAELIEFTVTAVAQASAL
jgi:hypothetical protein